MSPCDRYNPKKKVSCQILSIRLSKWERYNYKVCIYIFNKWTLASTSHKPIIGKYWVSEWLLFNANSAIFQLYHCENTLIFNEMIMCFSLDQQHALLDFNSASSLKQQSVDRHVAPLGNIIPILSKPVFAHSL